MTEHGLPENVIEIDDQTVELDGAQFRRLVSDVLVIENQYLIVAALIASISGFGYDSSVIYLREGGDVRVDGVRPSTLITALQALDFI